MDVTPTPLSGTMPLIDRQRLTGASSLVPVRPATGGGAGGSGAEATAAGPDEVRGSPDGPDIVLASGIHLRRRRIGAAQVTAAELLQAVRGVQLLPLAHQRAIAMLGVPVELLPVQHLEQVAGTTEPVVGATAVSGPIGAGVPTLVRIAARSPWAAQGGAQAIGEVVQHELGHVISVLTRQDRSEEAAIRYAQTY